MENNNVQENSRPKIFFDAECYLENTWGARRLGLRACSMEMFDSGKGRAMIEFVAGDDVEHIGLVYNKDKRVVDYDGVFSIPEEGIKFLNSLGFNTEDVEQVG